MSEHAPDFSDGHTPTRGEFCYVTTQASYHVKERCVWGHAYRRHHLYIRAGRYLLENKWNTNDYCTLYVIPEDAPRQRLCRHSAGDCGGNCGPWVPEEYVKVYEDGRLLAEGPWEDDLPVILGGLLAEVRQAKAVKAAEEEADHKQYKADQAQRFDEARAAIANAKGEK